MKLFQKFCFFLAIITGIFIFYISSRSFPPNPLPEFDWTSIIYHFGIFLIFCFLLALALQGNYFIVLIFSWVYAGLDELHQYFVPNRVCDIFDFYTDATGCIIGLFFALILIWCLNRNKLI